MPASYHAFIGSQHKFYALAAAAIGGVIVVLDLASGLTPEQLSRGFAVFLMMYFAGTVAGFAYPPQDLLGNDRLASIYWRYGRLPYFAAALAGLVHIVSFTDLSGAVLHFTGLLAVICLMPSLLVRLQRAGRMR